jgi:hypothetical protein
LPFLLATAIGVPMSKMITDPIASHPQSCRPRAQQKEQHSKDVKDDPPQSLHASILLEQGQDFFNLPDVIG